MEAPPLLPLGIEEQGLLWAIPPCALQTGKALQPGHEHFAAEGLSEGGGRLIEISHRPGIPRRMAAVAGQ
jgi:hypothetical protein